MSDSERKTESMLYTTDVTLLPDEIQDTLKKLWAQLAEHTDYEHAQLTYTNVQNDYEPRLDVIAPRPA